MWATKNHLDDHGPSSTTMPLVLGRKILPHVQSLGGSARTLPAPVLPAKKSLSTAA